MDVIVSELSEIQRKYGDDRKSDIDLSEGSDLGWDDWETR